MHLRGKAAACQGLGAARAGLIILAVCAASLVNMQNLWDNSPEDDPKWGSIINQLQANTAKRHHDTCFKLQINAYFYKLSIREEKPCQETQTERKRLAQHNNMIRKHSPNENNNTVSCKQGRTWSPAHGGHKDVLKRWDLPNFSLQQSTWITRRGMGLGHSKRVW